MASTRMRTMTAVRQIVIVLIALITAGPGIAETAKPAPASTGAISIATDPDGASVFVDGRPVGTTPVNIQSVGAGDHRVRVVKAGYLENARVVTVAAGRATPVAVKLTKAPEGGGQVTSTGGGGGGGGLLSNKLFWIGVAGAGAVTGVLLANRNHAPTPGTLSVSPSGTGVAAVTSFSVGSQGASDPDGDTLTVTVNFGDGVSAPASGGSASHIFPNAGTFNVTATVSDGKAEAETPPVPVTIRNISATWVNNDQSVVRTWAFTQTGTSANGTYTRNAAGSSTPGTVTATLTNPRSISGSAMSTGFTPFTFQGSFDSAVSVLTVIANGSGFNNTTLTFTRQ